MKFLLKLINDINDTYYQIFYKNNLSPSEIVLFIYFDSITESNDQ